MHQQIIPLTSIEQICPTHLLNTKYTLGSQIFFHVSSLLNWWHMHIIKHRFVSYCMLCVWILLETMQTGDIYPFASAHMRHGLLDTKNILYFSVTHRAHCSYSLKVTVFSWVYFSLQSTAQNIKGPSGAFGLLSCLKCTWEITNTSSFLPTGPQDGWFIRVSALSHYH